MPQLDPLQPRPEAILGENGTPVVHLQLTGQDDTPAWRATYNELAAKDDCPAKIDGPHGAPVLLVYLTDTSTDAAISIALDRASAEHLDKANNSDFLIPPESPTSSASKDHIGSNRGKGHVGHQAEHPHVVASMAEGSPLEQGMAGITLTARSGLGCWVALRGSE